MSNTNDLNSWLDHVRQHVQHVVALHHLRFSIPIDGGVRRGVTSPNKRHRKDKKARTTEEERKRFGDALLE